MPIIKLQSIEKLIQNKITITEIDKKLKYSGIQQIKIMDKKYHRVRSSI